jgi:hypothetical protein
MRAGFGARPAVPPPKACAHGPRDRVPAPFLSNPMPTLTPTPTLVTPPNPNPHLQGSLPGSSPSQAPTRTRPPRWRRAAPTSRTRSPTVRGSGSLIQAGFPSVAPAAAPQGQTRQSAGAMRARARLACAHAAVEPCCCCWACANRGSRSPLARRRFRRPTSQPPCHRRTAARRAAHRPVGRAHCQRVLDAHDAGRCAARHDREPRRLLRLQVSAPMTRPRAQAGAAGGPHPWQRSLAAQLTPAAGGWKSGRLWCGRGWQDARRL